MSLFAKTGYNTGQGKTHGLYDCFKEHCNAVTYIRAMYNAQNIEFLFTFGVSSHSMKMILTTKLTSVVFSCPSGVLAAL
jgi:hypothetical protein